MRAYIARALVKWVAGFIDSAYRCNCYEQKEIELLFARIALYAERYLFPIAFKLDKEAAATQMIEESWWG